MNDLYAAYGPLPSSIGVTPSPTPGSSSNKHFINPSNNVLLAVSPVPSQTRYGSNERNQTNSTAIYQPEEGHKTLRRKKEVDGQSQYEEQNVRPKGTLEAQPEPIQMIQQISPLEKSAARLRGSLQKLDSPIYTEKKWNGSNVSGMEMEQPFFDSSDGSYQDQQYGYTSENGVGFDFQIGEKDQHRCCLQSYCCKICCSVFACLIILVIVLASLYYFIKRM